MERAAQDHSGLILAARITFPPLFRLVGDQLAKIGGSARKHRAAEVGKRALIFGSASSTGSQAAPRKL
jgi:hypothetical protein